MPSKALARHAQTNLQLYEELIVAGWSEAALGRVRAAYELAMQLFSARFQPNGKPLLAHLVGTASVLARHGLAEDVVKAGLLHAAYRHGAFDDPRPGVTDRKRKALRAVLGADSEALVARYAALRWDGETIPSLRRRLRKLDAQERAVISIRLANELEDQLDFGMHYAGVHVYHELYRGPALGEMVAIARELGLPSLAEALGRTIRASNAAQRPEVLRRETCFGTVVLPGYGPEDSSSR